MEKKSGFKVLVSACLLGRPVRYDGCVPQNPDPRLSAWEEQGLVLAVCPEMVGGLPVPRPPAEIQNGTGADVLDGRAKVVNTQGQDVSRIFVLGAHKTLDLALGHGLTMALLMARSPSCGPECIYDGTFSRRLIPGRGVTAALLSASGIQIFGPEQLDQVSDLLNL